MAGANPCGDNGPVNIRGADAAQIARRHRLASAADRIWRSFVQQGQADEAAKDAAAYDDKPIQLAGATNLTRGMPLKRRSSPKLDGVDSMELAQLPRLPDTAEELKSIALALQADPAKVLNLGKDASEKNVKTMT